MNILKALKAFSLRKKDLKQTFTEKELTFAAVCRCRCGPGLAYPPGRDARAWVCSAFLVGKAAREIDHTYLPFALYEVKSEKDKSALGNTTRPKR